MIKDQSLFMEGWEKKVSVIIYGGVGQGDGKKLEEGHAAWNHGLQGRQRKRIVKPKFFFVTPAHFIVLSQCSWLCM